MGFIHGKIILLGENMHMGRSDGLCLYSIHKLNDEKRFSKADSQKSSRNGVKNEPKRTNKKSTA